MSLTSSFKLWHIQQCPLFTALPPAEVDELCRISALSTYGPGEPIDLDKRPGEYVWVVKRGHVKLNVTDSAGRQAAVILLSPGDLFGAIGEAPGDGFGEHCSALTEACVCRLSKPQFDHLLARHPDLGMRVARSGFDRIRRLQFRLAELMMSPAESRLAMCLLELDRIAGADAPGGRLIDLPVTHTDLAELIGTTREMVSVLMRRFREQGLVESGRRTIVLRDTARLAEIRDNP